MEEFKFEENSQAIFEKVIALAPAPFRKISKKNLTKALLSKVGSGGIVNEDIMMQVVREVTPKPFLKMGLKQIEPMLTKRES